MWRAQIDACKGNCVGSLIGMGLGIFLKEPLEAGCLAALGTNAIVNGLAGFEVDMG